jgi:hypothetical protein
MFQALIVGLVLTFSTVACSAADWGSYEGEVVTRWLKGGRLMQLMQNFRYTDPNGLMWAAPKESIVDGASIPQVAWSFIGGPFEGKYREASVIHDVACQAKIRPWELVHRSFYTAMLASGVEEWRAKTMYAAVYGGGPRWPRVIELKNVSENDLARRVKEHETKFGKENFVGAANIKWDGFPGLLGIHGPGPRIASVKIYISPKRNELTAEEFALIQQRIMTENPTLDALDSELSR